MTLLLDSTCSNTTFGRVSERIPGSLENRIIYYETDLFSIELNEMLDFFKSHDNISKGKEANIVIEFLLDTFFEYLRHQHYFDSVEYIERERGETLERNGLLYEFVDNGKRIRVWDDGKAFADLPRVAKIKRGEHYHTIICDPHVSGPRNFKGVDNKIYAARALVDTQNCTLSYLEACSKDYLHRSFHVMGTDNIPRGRPSASQFLNMHENNLLLIHCVSHKAISRYSNRVITRIKQPHTNQQHSYSKSSNLQTPGQ